MPVTGIISCPGDRSTRNTKGSDTKHESKPTKLFAGMRPASINNTIPKVINKDIGCSSGTNTRNKATEIHVESITPTNSSVTVNSENTTPQPRSGFLETISSYFRSVRKSSPSINDNSATEINHPLHEDKEKSRDSNTLLNITNQFNRLIPDFNSKHKKNLKTQIRQLKEEIKTHKKEKDNKSTERIEHAKSLKRKLKEELEKLKESTAKAKTFLLNYLTSLRDLHKCSKRTTEKDIRTIDEKTTLDLPHLVLDSPTGSFIEIQNLLLKLKPLRFEEQDNQSLPIIGIEKLTCKVSYPIENNQKIEIGLDIKDLEIKIKAEWTERLRGYVSSENPVTAVTALVAGLINKASRLPSLLWVKGDHIGIEFKIPDCTASHQKNRGESIRALPFPCHIECNTLTVNGDIKSLSLPADLSDAPFDGKVATECTNLEISLEHHENGDYLESDISTESLTVKLTDTSTVDDNENEPTSPKEITIRASGTLLHSDQNTVSVSPDIRVSGHSDAVPHNDGKNKPLYRVTDANITGTSFTQFFNKSPLSGETNTTYVTSTEMFSMNNTSIGPAKINSLRISMDQNLNGSINADKASVDMDELLKLMGNIKPVPWYVRLFLKGKRFKFSLTNPINQGNIDLSHLKITKLRCKPNKNASFMDRLFCTVLDWLVCPLFRRYGTFHTELQEKTQEKGPYPPVVNAPFLGIKLGLFNIKTGLPIPAHVIDPHTQSLNIIAALYEKGILLIHPKDVEQMTTQLELIKEGKPDTASRALQALIVLSKAKQATNQPGFIRLMAQQWPVDSIRNLAENNLLPQEMVNDLLTTIRLFSNDKESQPVALVLAQIIKQKVSSDTFKQLISEFKAELISDPQAQELYHELAENR